MIQCSMQVHTLLSTEFKDQELGGRMEEKARQRLGQDTLRKRPKIPV